jgi:hypothetical protein
MRNLIAVCLVMIPGLAFAAGSDDAYADSADRGAELLAPFQKNLKKALMSGLEGGPENAIAVCKIDAPRIASELSVDGIAMGRTSHRLRNPANASPDWVRPILDAYLASESERNPVVVELAGDRVGYVEPLLLQPPCVVCHGKTLAPGVAARIAEEYPQDEATGFDVGDLRGVWWVEFPAPDSAD